MNFLFYEFNAMNNQIYNFILLRLKPLVLLLNEKMKK
jgi:hypothetical protein